MARLFQLSIPTSGSVPMSVCGATLINNENGEVEIAMDPTDFNSNQWFSISANVSPQVLPIGSDKTILWVRQSTAGAPPAQAISISVWTEIDYKGEY